MKITILGNNGPFPAAGGACSSYLIEHDETKIAFDLGSGSLSNLMKIADPAELDAIFLSHLHWDHMTDIPVLFYNLHISRLNGREFSDIPLYMPDTPTAMFDTISGFSAFDINVLSNKSHINIKGINISAYRMPHPVESYALRFSVGGKAVVYSGDTVYDQSLAVFAAGCQVLITDSGFLESQLTESSPHMSAAQCARIASDAGVGRLVLSHLNPNTPVDEYLNEAKALFENTEAAVLMKTIEV